MPDGWTGVSEIPDRFILVHLDQVDIIGPDGRRIKLSEYVKENPPLKDKDDEARGSKAP